MCAMSTVASSRCCAAARLPKRLLKWLFGDFCEVLVLTPGKTVGEVEIHEVPPEVKEDAPV